MVLLFLYCRLLLLLEMYCEESYCCTNHPTATAPTTRVPSPLWWQNGEDRRAMRLIGGQNDRVV